jgi:hypothetical protein
MYSQFKTDKSREQTGLWLNYGSYQVRIARAGGSNKAFQKKIEVLTRPYRRAIATGTMEPELAEQLMQQAYAETVVLGWRVVQEDGTFVEGQMHAEDGSLLPYTLENVLATFKKLPDLYDDIREQAQSMVLFREGLREEASGN